MWAFAFHIYTEQGSLLSITDLQGKGHSITWVIFQDGDSCKYFLNMALNLVLIEKEITEDLNGKIACHDWTF